MRQYLEFIQNRAPAGTATALERLAELEGKKPAQIVREALLARLSSPLRAA